jgi:metal-responsive CopG/Arc/MetJ family transcriptional regulator
LNESDILHVNTAAGKAWLWYADNMKTIAITIDEDILDRIDRLVASGDGPGNRSRVIREAVREYLTQIERVAEEAREREIFRRNRKKLATQAAALVKEQARP